MTAPSSPPERKESSSSRDHAPTTCFALDGCAEFLRDLAPFYHLTWEVREHLIEFSQHAGDLLRRAVAAETRVAALTEAMVNLNTALDAYWNLEPDKPTQGRIKAVCAAQQRCAAILSSEELVTKARNP